MSFSMDQLYTFNDSVTKRVSSWDRRGMNRDYITMQPGEKQVLADLQGPGQINQLYCIIVDPVALAYRKMILRMYWDDEDEPSVEVPLGDFFCISNCTPRPVSSLLVTLNPGNKGKWCPSSYGMNVYFPMPFRKRALVELEYQTYENRESYPLMFWYHVNYDLGPLAENATGRFHAQWRREKLTRAPQKTSKNITLWDGVNLDGKENYRILEAEGKGQIVGLHLQIDNIAGGWYGEGDDMVFIDGETWPPSVHGTGTEEIFGGGACPCSEYSGPYAGYHLIENENFLGKNGMYRWYILNPIRFRKSVNMSIEHGHANNFENDYSSVVYWYQTEPHKPFPKLPSTEDRMPRFPEQVGAVEDRIVQIVKFQKKLEEKYGESDAFGLIWKFINDAAGAIQEKRYGDAIGTLDLNLDFLKKYVL